MMLLDDQVKNRTDLLCGGESCRGEGSYYNTQVHAKKEFLRTGGCMVGVRRRRDRVEAMAADATKGRGGGVRTSRERNQV